MDYLNNEIGFNYWNGSLENQENLEEFEGNLDLE